MSEYPAQLFDYKQTIDYLYSRLPAFNKSGGAAVRLGLANITALCNKLKNPQQAYKTIHVAGTNGKGSTSHALAAVLQTAGYQTGLYTSPHLVSFTERIRINGHTMPKEAVVTFVNTIRPLIDEIQPSFFEVTVAMAFWWFAQQEVDVAVIETGLGGRLDSTNVIRPCLSIITNISYDHKDLLGDTLPEIASEKAGIIKPLTPVVIGEPLPETLPIFEQKARQEQAPLHLAEQLVYLQKQSDDSFKVLHKQGDEVWFSKLRFDLSGSHQQKNLTTVLASVKILQQQKFNITKKVIKHSLDQIRQLTGLRGRWEQIHARPLTIADVAHNEAGFRYVTEQIRQQPYEQLYIILGMMKDKDRQPMYRFLPKEAHYICCMPALPRACPADVLAEEVKNYIDPLSVVVSSTPKEALKLAHSQAHPDHDFVFVGGSTFTVAGVLTTN